MADDEAKVYSFQDVVVHNNSKDCWLIIGGKVYDVTEFLEDHPGGEEVLLLATGKDATGDFEDVGHSTTAKAMMEEYYVGKLDTSSLPSKPIDEPKEPPPPEQSSNSFVKLLQFLVPLIILVLALGLRYFTKSS